VKALMEIGREMLAHKIALKYAYGKTLFAVHFKVFHVYVITEG